MGQIPLVVDVDRCLLSTDLLWEGGVRLLADSPGSIPAVFASLLSGRAAFKARVAESISLDLSSLPLNESVLTLIREAGEQGRPVVLASAAHHDQVRQLARRVGADDVLASNDGPNLKGQTKLEHLQKRFDEFDYVGDAPRDLPILEAARKGYLARPSLWTRLRAWIYGTGDTEILEDERPSRVEALIRATRPHQWAKNALLLLPIAAAHLPLTAALALKILVGFAALSLAASGVYLINDVADLAADRRHGSKQHRPLAAGDLSIPAGLIAAAIFITGAIVLSLTQPLAFTACVAGYLALNLSYSFAFKERLLVDVILLAALYTLRVVAGAALVEIPLTGWFLAFSVFLFLSLALLKRVVELQRTDLPETEHVPGRAYRPADGPLLKMAGVGSGLMSAVVYCLYIAGPQAKEMYERPELLWAGLPLFLYWLVRIWLLADRGEVDEDPVAHVVTDRASYLVLFTFLAVVVAAT